MPNFGFVCFGGNHENNHWKRNISIFGLINEKTKLWGVYSIPRMWRDISGRLVIRFNGEVDCGDTDNMVVAPNLYFISEDDGKTWSDSYSIIGKTLEEYRAEGKSEHKLS